MGLWKTAMGFESLKSGHIMEKRGMEFLQNKMKAQDYVEMLLQIAQ